MGRERVDATVFPVLNETFFPVGHGKITRSQAVLLSAARKKSDENKFDCDRSSERAREKRVQIPALRRAVTFFTTRPVQGLSKSFDCSLEKAPGLIPRRLNKKIFVLLSVVSPPSIRREGKQKV